MVYRGRPSKGCGECRRKKIRCDQTRPACSQCLKSKENRPCPGYRDTQTLKFFDESDEVARKAQAKQAIKARRWLPEFEDSISPSDSGSSRSSGSHELCAIPSRNRSVISSRTSSMSCALMPSLENQGIRYFIANYVMGDSDSCAGHLQNLLSQKTTQSKTLQVAMGAVGLAGLSNQRSDPSLMTKARHEYAIALRMTKSHLADLVRCKQDRTITAVALLGLFEVLTCSSSGSLKSWANHIDGSIAIINLRGSDLLKSESGSAIFTQARSHILISCYQRTSRVPPTILALSHQLSQNSNLACRVANDLLDLVSQLCELRASIKDRSIPTPALAVSSLLSIDDQLLCWASERSSHWDHTIVFDSTQPDAIYDDCYATYQTHWIAGTWNIQRAARIFVQETILAQLDKMTRIIQHQALPDTITLKSLLDQRTQSLAAISEMASEICASAPYLLGHDRSYDEQLNNPTPAACGYFLLPSLYLAGSTMGVSTSMRMFALGRLRYIGYKLGIQQALLAAGILEAKIEDGEVEGLPSQMNRGMCKGSWGGRDEGTVEERRDDGEDIYDEEVEGKFAQYLGDLENERAMMEEIGDELERVEVV